MIILVLVNMNVLLKIYSLCIKYNAEYGCIGGDINAKFSGRESFNTMAILQFIGKYNLYVPLNHSDANVDYSYSNVSTNLYSIIDHVLVQVMCLMLFLLIIV